VNCEQTIYGLKHQLTLIWCKCESISINGMISAETLMIQFSFLSFAQTLLNLEKYFKLFLSLLVFHREANCHMIISSLVARVLDQLFLSSCINNCDEQRSYIDTNIHGESNGNKERHDDEERNTLKWNTVITDDKYCLYSSPDDEYDDELQGIFRRDEDRRPEVDVSVQVIITSAASSGPIRN